MCGNHRKLSLGYFYAEARVVGLFYPKVGYSCILPFLFYIFFQDAGKVSLNMAPVVKLFAPAFPNDSAFRKYCGRVVQNGRSY